MDTDSESEKPSRLQTPTADAVSKYLKGIKEVQDHARSESSMDQDMARTQAKEFALIEDEILETIRGLSFSDNEPVKIVNGGLVVSNNYDVPSVGVDLNSQTMERMSVDAVDWEGFNEETKKAIRQTGVNPVSELRIEMVPDSESLDPILSHPALQKSDTIYVEYFFDKFGNYAKIIDLLGEKIDISGHPEIRYMEDREWYVQEMTPGDFELVGFTLQFLKDRLNK